MSQNLRQIARQQIAINKIRATLAREVGQLTVNFAKDNFKRQAFSGEAPWPPRKREDAATRRRGRRAILIKTGALRRSIRILKVGKDFVVVGSSLRYAAIHNEGGVIAQRITITPKMRKFFWAMWYKTKDEKWKAMALKQGRISRRIRMPQRKFLGPSPRLDAMIDQHIRRALKSFL